MKRLKDAGYGGCIFFNKPPTGFSREEYLSDYWFEVTENFIIAAGENSSWNSGSMTVTTFRPEMLRDGSKRLLRL